MLKDTSENFQSGLKEDFTAPFTKQEKDLLRVWAEGGWTVWILVTEN